MEFVECEVTSLQKSIAQQDVDELITPRPIISRCFAQVPAAD
jgi:hypothetical protein